MTKYESVSTFKFYYPLDLRNHKNTFSLSETPYKCLHGVCDYYDDITLLTKKMFFVDILGELGLGGQLKLVQRGFIQDDTFPEMQQEQLMSLFNSIYHIPVLETLIWMEEGTVNRQESLLKMTQM